ELSVQLITPDPYAPVVFESHAVCPTCRNSNHIGKFDHRNRSGALVRSAVADLSTTVLAPGPDGAVALQRQGMSSGSRHLRRNRCRRRKRRYDNERQNKQDKPN